MIQIPTYKKIHINSHERRMIFAQLDQLEFGKNPFIFAITHLVTQQQEAIENIQEYFDEKGVSCFPYPLLVIGDVQNYAGDLTVISDDKKIPKFFDQKLRPLNVKETTIMNKVGLKQKNLQNIQEIDYRPTVEEYARTHKIIYNLQSENLYLKDLEEKLVKHYEQKEE